jgi:transcriptional regulator with XRE-family HTH domain
LYGTAKIVGIFPIFQISIGIFLNLFSMIDKNLKYLRKQKGFTQAQMVDFIGIDGNKLSDYERGKSKPSIEAIIQISELFRVSVKDLVMSDLENAHLNENLADKKNTRDAQVNSHGNAQPNRIYQPFEPQTTMAAEDQQPYGSRIDYQAKYLSLLEEVLAERASFSHLPKRLLDVESKLDGLLLFLSKSIGALTNRPESRIMEELSTYLHPLSASDVAGTPTEVGIPGSSVSVVGP